MLRVGQENMLRWSVEMFHGSPLWEANPTEGGICAQSKTQPLL